MKINNILVLFVEKNQIMLYKSVFFLIIFFTALNIILTSNMFKLYIQRLIKTVLNLSEIPIQKLPQPIIHESTKLFNRSIFMKAEENEQEKRIQKLPEALIIGSPKCGIYIISNNKHIIKN